MRLLFLSHEFPPVGGGGGQWVHDVARLLVKRGHEVRVITAHIKGMPKEEIVDGISILRLPSLREEAYRVGFFSMALYALSACQAGYKLMRQWHPDLIQVVFAVPAGVPGYVLSKIFRVPYMISAHLGDVPGGVPEKTGKWFRWVFPLTKPIWRKAVRITAVSNFTASLIKQHYQRDAIVIPNGFNREFIAVRPIEKHDPPTVVFAGRFVTQKNLLTLVEILASLQDLPWKCKLIGDGPLRQSIEEAIRGYGLADRFEITGWVTPENAVGHLRSGDILFMPSLSEGLSIAGVQGIAVGLAVVAYNVGGFDSLVMQGVNGILAEPGDKEKLTQGLRTYLSDSQALLDARRASLQHAEKFDMENIVDAYEQLYDEVIKP